MSDEQEELEHQEWDDAIADARQQLEELFTLMRYRANRGDLPSPDEFYKRSIQDSQASV